MNVRVHPSMRCTLDEEEKVLRIITKGAVEHQDDLQEDRKFEVVIYALKVCISQSHVLMLLTIFFA